MIFAILNEAANKGDLILVDGGMVHFTVRRDRVVTIHEIIVLPRMRRKGIAQKMIRQLQDENPGYRLRALCPVGYESNKFWEGIGFTHCGIKKSGEKTPEDEGSVEEVGVSLNVWMMEAKGCITDGIVPRTLQPAFVFRGKKNKK